MKRREFIKTMAAAAGGLTMFGSRGQSAAPLCAGPVVGDPRVRGPFPILSTPFTASGDVDYEVLA
ncbi:MAG: hypothetical protein N2689_13265, partial [Verrucomicrobiae bacterium]|nr:hypothetical protein [Verrucomicrobiae bacterium]